MNVVAGLRDRLEGMPLFRWATVVGTNPLRVQLDGDPTPLSADPVNLTGDRVRGERVWTVSVDRRLYILGGVSSSPAPTPPVGAIMAYAGVTVPDEWLVCDGTSYRKADYPALAAVLGATGAGRDFVVPDLRGGGGTHNGLSGVNWIIKT
nr:MAG TPA: tail collar domain [Caudoviricetes sp.]